MTFDQQVLLWCIAAPAVLVAGACVLAAFVDRFAFKASQSKIGSLLVAIAWILSIYLSMVARQDWQFIPQENWQYFIAPLLLWGVLGHGSIGASDKSLKWILVALISGVTAALCLPRGDGWEDAYPEHGPVGIALLLGMLINTWSYLQMAKNGADRWLPLVSLASLGGPLALAASSYASLAESSVAMISATLVLALYGLLVKDGGAAWVAPIATISGLCILAAGKFQTFEEHPVWLYLLLLALPTIIFGFDLLVRKQPTWMRVTLAAFVASATVAISAWYFLLQSTESW